MRVDELAPGLWRWTAGHPDWREDADWQREVGCIYYEAPDAVVLIDPLIPDGAHERERFLTALDADLARLGRPLALLETVSWHERSIPELAERYGATVGVPPAGVVEFPLGVADETGYWLPEHLAVVPGDTLLGDADGGLIVCPDSWLEGEDPAALRTALRALLDLPVERILLSHGEPVLSGGHAALAAALAT
jgi:glyoxylase-like metal-dependent hydrolase (beta-lactamase superfamily II)